MSGELGSNIFRSELDSVIDNHLQFEILDLFGDMTLFGLDVLIKDSYNEELC